MGLLERENAAVLNACLGDVAELSVRGIRDAVTSLGLEAPLFISQNDGTLMDAEFAYRFPVLTISSGPTNSMRGAAFLSGVRDGIVADVGGTSTDVGALVKGFPREAAVEMDIAGVRTNFRMPDTLSIPLGGGSLVQPEPLRIGPESTGFRLSTDALVFGGRTLTATDVAVAAGQARVGDPHRVESLDAHLVERVMAEMKARLESAIDRIKTSAHDVPVILVGGGNILVGDILAGASRVLRPEHAEVANAIGAAIAQVGGQVERVYSLGTYGQRRGDRRLPRRRRRQGGGCRRRRLERRGGRHRRSAVDLCPQQRNLDSGEGRGKSRAGRTRPGGVTRDLPHPFRRGHTHRTRLPHGVMLPSTPPVCKLKQ